MSSFTAEPPGGAGGAGGAAPGAAAARPILSRKVSEARLRFASRSAESRRSLMSILSEDAELPIFDTMLADVSPVMYSKVPLPDWILRWTFAVLYVLQLCGSIMFLRWASTFGWNDNSPVTSALFLWTEVVAFISSSLFLFCGLLWIFRAPEIPSSEDETQNTTEHSSSEADLERAFRISEEVLVDEQEVTLNPVSEEPHKDDPWISKRPSIIKPSKPVARRKSKSLGEFPTVAVCVCRYKEPLEDLLQTVECMNQIQWPGQKLQLFILDDGWYATDDECRHLQARELADLMGSRVPRRGLPTFDTCLQTHRPDCATECNFWRIRKASRFEPEITLIARKKPSVSQYKAGNVNNFLYNYLGHAAATGHDVPEYMLLLDHDMLPHADFVKDSIPRLQDNSDVAFVQYPQRFYDIAGSDQLYAGNEIFFDGVQVNRSLAGIAAFAGTNAVWNLQALYHVGGFQYGSLTEDASTGLAVNVMGYRSLYAERELAVGQSPQTVEDAMQQRMRWSQGAVEIFFTYARAWMCCRSALSYVDPSAELQLKFSKEQPPPPSVARRIVMSIIYFDSMVYPLYSMGFLLHVLVAFFYLYNVQAPMAPNDPIQLLYIWLPLYIVKAACQVLAFPQVSLTAQWNSQMAWAGYSLSTLNSIGKAIFPGSGGWFNTGAASKKRFVLQYGNTTIAVALYAMIIYRAVAFIAIDKTCSAWTTVGALLYGLIMIMHVRGWALMPFRRKASDEDAEGSALLNNSMRLLPSESTRASVQGTEWHDRAIKKSVKSREEHHSFDLSLFVIFFHVVLLSCLLFFWASLNCDGSIEVIVPSSAPPSSTDLPIPLLPPNVSADAEFAAEDGRLYLNGKPFFVKGINWFGFETESNMVFGLEATGQDTVMKYLVEQGFNAIRLPLAAASILEPESYRLDRSLIPLDEDLNPHMDTSEYLTAVESFIDRASVWGVFVLLDIHRLRNSQSTYPLPYDDRTPFSDVKRAWAELAKLFCGKWSVMGSDLFNEPHEVTWGTDDATDWRLLAEELSEVVSMECPQWLQFVEGMREFNRAEDSPITLPFTQWGSVVRPAMEYPLRVANQSKLVYSPHIYGPGTVGENIVWMPESCGENCYVCYCTENVNKTVCDWPRSIPPETVHEMKNNASPVCRAILPFSERPYPSNMGGVWDYIFGDLIGYGHTIVIGEWGGTYIDEPTNSAPGLAVDGESQVRDLEAKWNQALESYLFQRGIGSFYWSLNPESDDTGGLLVDWKTPNTAKQALLRRLPATDPLPILFPVTDQKKEIVKCLEEEQIHLLTEGSQFFEFEAKTYNMAFDGGQRNPVVIVFPQSEEQVSSAIRCAASSTVSVCIRSGGNSYTGDSSCSGLLLDVRNLRRFQAVNNGQLYWLGTGFTSGELTTMLSEVRRFIPIGAHGGVAMGYFFGCGHGRLSRKYGLGCDGIVAARIVTANGEIVEARDDNEYAELLFAIRGSGASHFGVVTSVLMETPVTSAVEPATSFLYMWPRNRTAEVIRVWQDWAPSHANLAFSCDLALFHPDSGEGVRMEGALFGDQDELEEIFAPIVNQLGPPMTALTREASYLDFVADRMGADTVFAIRNPNAGYRRVGRRGFLNKSHMIQKPLDKNAIDTLIEFANAVVPGVNPYDSYIQIKASGGAIAESQRPSCFGHRTSLGLIQYVGYWTDSAAQETVVFHQRRFHRTMSKYLGPSSFYNYKDNDITTEWEKAYWGSEYAARLSSLKCEVDAQNLFSSAQQSLRCAEF